MQVLAYHVIFSTHGFWLPNDPRGSNSSEVRAANIQPFGPPTLVTHTRRSVANAPHDRSKRFAAKRAMVYPEVTISGEQARSVGHGFGEQVRKSGYSIYACCILPQHVHLVVARHHYDIEQVVRLLRQSATAHVLADTLHPFAAQRTANGRLPSVWGQDFRKVFLFTPDEIRQRIQYVEDNPLREGKRRQKWSFVIPYVES